VKRLTRWWRPGGNFLRGFPHLQGWSRGRRRRGGRRGRRRRRRKPFCSECLKEQNNNVIVTSTAAPELTETLVKQGRKMSSVDVSGPTTEQQLATASLITEVTTPMFEPTEPGFGVTEPGVHGPRPHSYASPWPGTLSPGTLERLARNHRQQRFQWGAALPPGKLHALPAIRASSLSSSSSGGPVASGKGIKKSGKRRWSTNTSRRRGRASGRRPGKGRGVLRVDRRRVPKPPGLE